MVKERFDSCLKTSQSLQSYITNLYAKLDSNSSHSTSGGGGTSHNKSWASSLSSSHQCGDKCKASAVDDLNITTSNHAHHHHRDHSHRHSLPPSSSNTTTTTADAPKNTVPLSSSSSSSLSSFARTASLENPFAQKSRAATLSSTQSMDSPSSTSDK